MKLKEIEAIYLLKRDKLLRGKFSQESPIAFIHPDSYSAETQLFSNFFTEALIQEAITHRYNTLLELEIYERSNIFIDPSRGKCLTKTT